MNITPPKKKKTCGYKQPETQNDVEQKGASQTFHPRITLCSGVLPVSVGFFSFFCRGGTRLFAIFVQRSISGLLVVPEDP